MAVLTVRNVPDELMKDLKDLAAQNRRSLQQQVIFLLEGMVVTGGPSPAELAADIRRRLAGRDIGDLAEDVRAERQR